MPLKKHLGRAVIFTAAFVIPPIMIGMIATFSQLSSVMILRAPEINGLALPAGGIEGVAPPALPEGPNRIRAAIVTSNDGTQLTDLLGVAEVLARSERVDVFTAAPERKPSPTTGLVGFLPHYSFENAPDAELLVVPAVLDSTNPRISDWIASRAPKAKLVLVVCEGARVAARARILANRYATSHFMALGELEKTHPETHWLRNRRYVIDQNVITTGGVTASLDGALFALETLFGRKVAEGTAGAMGLNWNREARPDPLSAASSETLPSLGPSSALQSLRGGDFLQLVLRGGYDWFRSGAGVLLFPGMSDLSVAAPLEVLARTQSYYLFTVASSRGVVRTRSGIDLIPTDSAQTAPPAEVLFVPSRDLPLPPSGTPEDPLSEPSVRKWLVESGVHVSSAVPEKPGSAFPRIMSFLSITQGNAITDFAARTIEYRGVVRSPEAAPDLPARLLIRPFLIGFASLTLAFFIDRRLKERNSSSRDKPRPRAS